MFTIAIDGPSGSGKSTAAKATARRLGCRYLDTGAMYRAAAVGCMSAGLTEPADVAQFCCDMDLDISTDPDRAGVTLGGVDVTDAIRDPEVSAWVSRIAVNPDCRTELVRRQRELLASDSFVVEGRDITTVVAPDADVRVLLTADEAERMARRGAELGGRVDEAGLRDQVVRRDKDDSTLVNFTVAADGVATIDSTFLTPGEVVDQILMLARSAGITVR
ncbi:MAG: (d)CMP kinase [Propionibacteriaceae bacterium]|nr:(d)CMP kinase [Propionibacteriaceae bacterium]